MLQKLSDRLAALVIAMLLCTLFLPSVPSFAQADELKRADILRIAQRYASNQWTATAENALHIAGTINTPDREYYTTWDDGIGWAIGNNNSIPYQWGGWSALADNDLDLVSDTDGLYFDEQIEANYAAGDIYTQKSSQYPDRNGHGAAGVDCSGLVSRAWRTNVKYGASGLRNISRPVKFADLRPGDILVTNGHIVLFEAFLTVEKETVNTTRISVIEASRNDWKVSKREYTLTGITQHTETWENKRYATDTVTLTSGTTVYSGYSPRTYLTPIDVILVIDRSGSMGGDKLLAAKNASKMFVDLMRTGDKIGVVDFDNITTVTYQLTEIDAGQVTKTAAKNAIDSLYARGATSIGGGLQAAQNQLKTLGPNDPVKIIVLLSDGQENTAPLVSEVLPGVMADEITVQSVGLGSDADQVLMETIAKQTGGLYRFAPDARALWDIYNSMLVTIYGGSVARTASGTVVQGQMAEESVLVDSSVGTATFAVFWPGSDLDLTLVRPDGTIIDPVAAEADPRVTYASNTTYEFYTVDAPQHGEWKLRIFGVSTISGGEPYSISASVTDAMDFAVTTDRGEYQSGRPINITASIEDSFLDVTTPQYVLGVSMQVVAQDPSGDTYPFELFDDGQHGDSAPNDGVYGNAFADTSLVGSYNFDIQVSGVNNRDGQPFIREYALSTVVKPGLHVGIDVWPFSERNVVVLNKDHRIPVSIASTEAFSATAEVDTASLTFGRTGAEATLESCLEIFADVNGDGRVDLTCIFRSSQAGFQLGDTEATLKGITTDGRPFTGSDSVEVIPDLAMRHYQATLNGNSEVPPVSTSAVGVAKFDVDAAITQLKFRVDVSRLTNVTAIHIHCGATGMNGPVGVTLFSGASATRRTFQGAVAGPDTGNACGWVDLDAVVTAMFSGDTYVNVNTTTYPAGQIRGQIRSAK